MPSLPFRLVFSAVIYCLIVAAPAFGAEEGAAPPATVTVTTGSPEGAAAPQGADGQHPTLFRMPPTASSAPTITPNTALKDAGANPYPPAFNARNATSIPEWSAARIREIFPYNNATGPAPGSETMPRLTPLR